MNYNSSYQDSEDEDEKYRYIEDVCKQTLNLQESYGDSLDLRYGDELFITKRKRTQEEQETELRRKLIRISKKVCMSFILGSLGYLSSRQAMNYKGNGVDYLPNILIITSGALLGLSCYMGFSAGLEGLLSKRKKD